jgi:membrane protein required for beta-lactamase induction
MNILYILSSFIFWFVLLGTIETIGYCGIDTWQFWVIAVLIVFVKPFINGLYKSK